MTLRPGAAPSVAAVDHLLDDALLRVLEPTIAALDRILDEGPAADDGMGEPDGFDGLDRLGEIEHLIATDWLLVGEEPDEFVRRYSERELSYLRRAHVRPRRPPTTLVVFDVGPDQIGRPRAVQLACLVALARRAQESGAELAWGTLQSFAPRPVRGAAEVTRLAGARTHLPPPDDLPVDALVDDCLVVARHAPGASHQLHLSDEGDGVRAVLVDHRRGVRRSAHVPLPPPGTTIRLLRDPLGAGAGLQRVPGMRPLTSNLVFDHNGNKVLARAGSRAEVIVLPAPNSPNSRDEKVKVIDGIGHLGPVAAAGRVGRAVVTLTVIEGGGAVYVNRVGPTKGRAVPSGSFPVDQPLAPTVAGDRLGTVRWDDGTLRAELAGRGLVQQADGSFVTGPAADELRWMAVTARAADGGWVVRAGPDETVRRFPAGERVFGIGRLPTVGTALLAVEGDNQVVAARVGGGPNVVLCRAEAPIVDAVAHHHRPLYAYRTTEGHVAVRSWATGDRHLLWQPV